MPVGSGISAQLGYAEETYTNEVQTVTITGSPTGGSFTLTFDGAATTAIAFNASASAVQAALEALPNIGAGGVVCAGGPLPGAAVTVTFSSLIHAGTDVPEMTATSSLTGGTSPTVTVAETTKGSGYGSYQVPDRFLEFRTEGLALQQDYIESSAIRAGAFVRRADRRIVNRKGVSGQIVHEVASKGYGRLFRHCFGAAAISTPSGGTLTRDHTFTLADAWGMSLTVQKGVPRQASGAGNVDAFSYLGCKITEWELANSVDELLTLSITVDGRDEDLTRALAAVSFPAGLELLSFAGGQITIAGANEDVTNFSLTRSAGLKTDRYYLRKSTLKKQPIMADLSEISGSIEMDYEGSVAYERFRSGAIAELTALWEASVIESTFRFGVLVTLPAVQFTGETPTIGGPDVIMQPLPFRVLAPVGGGEPITLRYRTTDTAP